VTVRVGREEEKSIAHLPERARRSARKVRKPRAKGADGDRYFSDYFCTARTASRRRAGLRVHDRRGKRCSGIHERGGFKDRPSASATPSAAAKAAPAQLASMLFTGSRGKDFPNSPD
jgi:hypothetical protein